MGGIQPLPWTSFLLCKKPKKYYCNLCPLESLPDLVTRKILEFLSLREALVLRQVSKSMRIIVDQNVNMAMTLSSETFPLLRAGRLPFCGKFLRVLDFQINFMTQKGLIRILKTIFPLVTIIEVEGAMSFQNYRSLTVACYLLTDLRLGISFFEGDENLDKIQAHCITLKHLSITLEYLPHYRQKPTKNWTRNLSMNLTQILQTHHYPALQTFHLKLGYNNTDFPDININISHGLLLNFTHRQKNLRQVTFDLPKFAPWNPSTQTEVLNQLKSIPYTLILKINYLHPTLAQTLDSMGILNEGKSKKQS